MNSTASNNGSTTTKNANITSTTGITSPSSFKTSLTPIFDGNVNYTTLSLDTTETTTETTTDTITETTTETGTETTLFSSNTASKTCTTMNESIPSIPGQLFNNNYCINNITVTRKKRDSSSTKDTPLLDMFFNPYKSSKKEYMEEMIYATIKFYFNNVNLTKIYPVFYKL